MSDNIEWTPEMIAKLRALWAQTDPKLSTDEIGRKLGCSKSAAIGKAHRIGVAARPSPIRPPGGNATPDPRRPRSLEGPTLPIPASIDGEPPSPLMEKGPPRAWSLWCGQLATPVFNKMRRAKHKGDCPVSLQRLSIRLWECTCGVSQPGSGVVAKASLPAVLKPVAPIVARPKSIVRAAVPEPITVVVPTLFKPRRQAQCCWPTGEKKTLRYCDDVAEPGRPYCSVHCAQAYTKHRSDRVDVTAGLGAG